MFEAVTLYFMVRRGAIHGLSPHNTALGTQCGFASTLLGNLICRDDMRRKLELVVKIARRVWG
jgi:hypothetical protein